MHRKRDGHVCADAKYSYGSSCLFEADRVDVEMSIDTDLNFIPFLFQSILAHIQGTKEAEQLFRTASVSLLFNRYSQ
jgi:hypothetical protein